eukprot:TRINITY_DN14337_c0_g1_i1.p1 TRINITY_DN14337_c0_g1~~TRINITY_DN14337_c0_g1_i1.p1  ORF type:complete len:156 (-),score=22.39 TRINITY_DN14337_c0_g1_i1:341-751(-)
MCIRDRAYIDSLKSNRLKIRFYVVTFIRRGIRSSFKILAKNVEKREHIYVKGDLCKKAEVPKTSWSPLIICLSKMMRSLIESEQKCLLACLWLLVDTGNVFSFTSPILFSLNIAFSQRNMLVIMDFPNCFDGSMRL